VGTDGVGVAVGGGVAGVRLGDLLFEPPGAPPDALMVHASGVDSTRAEVQARAVEVAGALVGVGEGAAVGVMLPNSADLIATLFAVWRVGGAYVPLNPRLGQDDLAHVLATVPVAVIVTVAGYADRFPGLRQVVLHDGGVEPREGSGAPTRFDADVALVQFTSGTTGRPKPVLLLHSGVVPLLDNVVAKLRGASGGREAASAPAAAMPNLIPVSLSLWAGIYNVLFAFRVGAPVVVMDGFDPEEFARLVRRFEIRSTVLPPAAMTMLSDSSLDGLAPLRFVRSITAPLSVAEARRFRDRFGIAVLNSYGQTEIGGEIVGWSAADSRQFGESKLGSVGRPHAGVEVRVVDGSDGTDVAASEAGELWVRTPALSAGYADGGDLSDRITDGWFRTGDIGRVDADGFVWIEGRVSDMINRGGLKVFPGEVEEAIRHMPGVADVAVVAAPDERLGEVPWAFVVASDDGRVDAGLVIATCRQRLAPYKVPVRVVGVEALPRNEVGKVLRSALLEQAAARGSA
jgi:acyl-CoA synthetase (AMP-forming)/AMP-acid ligase II